MRQESNTSYLALAGLALAAGLPFAAYANDGLYVGTEVGINTMTPEDFATPHGALQFNATYNTGSTFGLVAGYGFKCWNGAATTFTA